MRNVRENIEVKMVAIIMPRYNMETHLNIRKKLFELEHHIDKKIRLIGHMGNLNGFKYPLKKKKILLNI